MRGIIKVKLHPFLGRHLPLDLTADNTSDESLNYAERCLHFTNVLDCTDGPTTWNSFNPTEIEEGHRAGTVPQAPCPAQAHGVVLQSHKQMCETFTYGASGKKH